MEVKAGFKKTEVGIVPEDWDVVRLESIADIDADNLTASTSQDYAFNYISLEDVDQGILRNYSSQVFGSAPSRARRRLRFNDLLIATVRPNLRSHLLFKKTAGEWICSTGFSVVRCKCDLASCSYVFSHLFAITVSKQIDALLTGSNYPAINSKDVKLLQIPIPPTLGEQEAIAEALSDADALIEALEGLLAKKRQVKQGAMQELLTGKKRLLGFSGEWEVRKLGEIAEIVSGGTPSTRIGEYWNGNINWCIPTDITSTPGKYLYTTEKRITELGLKNSSATLLPKGTLLLCSRATIGEVKIAADVVSTNQGSKSLICFDQVYNEFLYYLLLTMKSKLIEKAIGSTFLEITKKEMSLIEIRLPTVSEQTAIAEILSDMDAEIAALEGKLAKARQVKQGMMQELLTGRVRLIQVSQTCQV